MMRIYLIQMKLEIEKIRELNKLIDSELKDKSNQ